ncbi:hypothetical protein DAPPUDRAFT_320826 [Daphnia pulex]|uniref:THAP-type domain-containing protein n=1 Tax=Daphnia pulex TaxID=6669 RepID=E9GR62_DAPPU|nr:hypothetical protein DAPPUDRAFT_320826 [Daphnia pulex]|eukprot:EFX77951.1 hypothetical protein DAPPUDRAFT_320826 [Daphnia pulex]
MRKKCLLKNCTNKTYGENLKSNVSFHRLTKDENVIQKWIDQLKKNKEVSGFAGNYEITFSKTSVVCSDHIENNCFEQSYLQRKLKRDAVPTIFTLEKTNQPAVPKRVLLEKNIPSGIGQDQGIQSLLNDIPNKFKQQSTLNKLRSHQIKVIDLKIDKNEERCDKNSENLEASIYSKELESNVDIQMQENEINNQFEVIPNSERFADDRNLLRNSTNNVAMQHEIISQILNFSREKCIIRYHQWTIKYSIILQGRSPTLYEFIRQHNLLTLPTKKTILTYTGKTRGQVGITNVNKASLKCIFESLTQDHEKRVSIEVDEMQYKALLLWIQSRQEFVGQVDFGEVDVYGDVNFDIDEEEITENSNNEYQDEDFQENIECDPPRISPGAAFQEDEDQQSQYSTRDPILVNSLLNFMVTGLTTKFSALVGSWPVAKLTACQLYFVTLHVIKTLESIGFLVDRIVGDNASVNVKLFQLLRQPCDEDSFKVTHPVDPKRPLFVS